MPNFLGCIFLFEFVGSRDITHPNPGRREKIKLNSYFHTSLCCLKRCYEGLKSLYFNTTFRNVRDGLSLNINLNFTSIKKGTIVVVSAQCSQLSRFGLILTKSGIVLLLYISISSEIKPAFICFVLHFNIISLLRTPGVNLGNVSF